MEIFENICYNIYNVEVSCFADPQIKYYTVIVNASNDESRGTGKDPVSEKCDFRRKLWKS